jgi:hypothetical protein
MKHPELSELTLTEEQIKRILITASDDSNNWIKEAQDGVLPAIEKMHLDWWVDPDLGEAGITDEIMQRISFRIAEQSTAAI